MSHSNKKYSVKRIIDRPNLVGMFGIDADGTYSSDLSLLRYVTEVNGPVHMDLTIHDNNIPEDNESESESVAKEPLVLTEEYIEHVKTNVLKSIETGEVEKNINRNFYKYLMKHPEVLCRRAVSNIQDITFIASRRALKFLGNLSYEKKMFNYFKAYLIGGIIYILHAHDSDVELFTNASDKKLDELNSATEEVNPGKAWGLVFEDYMLSEHPIKKPDPHKVSNPHQSTRKSFICVYELKFFDHDILYGGELDGVIPPKDHEYLKNNSEEESIKALSDMEFVELKSSLKGENTSSFRFFKTKNIWMQCSLSRVTKVFIGYRTLDGITYEVKKYSVPELVQKSEGWYPSRMNDCINDCLTFVKQTFIEIIEKIPQSMKSHDLTCLPTVQVNFMSAPRSSRLQIILIPEALDENCLGLNYELFLATLTWKEFGKDINSAIKKALFSESNEVDLFKKTINEICQSLITEKYTERRG